jgi:hypothetical protein
VKRIAIVAGVCLTLVLQVAMFAQGRPDFTGTWRFNQAKSSPNIAGNTPIVPFPSQIVVKQTPTELHVEGSSVRQQPTSAVFKLDGSKVTIKAPSGITETGEAKFEGSNMVITSRRSFTSPLGETIVDFKEVWTLNGNVLTIEKTRTESGDSATEKAVFDLMLPSVS